MAPVTPNVPPTVSLPVIVALAKVEAPADRVDENVPAPVTFKVLQSDAAPEVVNVVKAPVLAVVDPIGVLCILPA